MTMAEKKDQRTPPAKKESVIIRGIRKSDLWEIARLHIYQYTMGIPMRGQWWRQRTRFYYDKFKFFLDIEPEGVFIAEVNGEVAGFLSVTLDWRRFNRKMYFSLRFFKLCLDLALFQYGIHPGFLRWMYRTPMRFLRYGMKMIFGRFYRKTRTTPQKPSSGSPVQPLKGTEDAPRLDKLPVRSPAPARWINMAVNSKFRRRGIARKFIESAIQYTRDNGGRECGCTVHVDTIPVLRLYYSMGFEVVGRWMTSYGECMVLVKRLDVED